MIPTNFNREPNPMPILDCKIGDVARVRLEGMDTDFEMTVVGISRGMDCGGVSILVSIWSSAADDGSGKEKVFSADEGASLVGVVHTCPSGSGTNVIFDILAATRFTAQGKYRFGPGVVWQDWQEMAAALPTPSLRQSNFSSLFDLLGGQG